MADIVPAGFTFCGLGALSFLGRLPPSTTSKGSQPQPSASHLRGLSNPARTIRWLVSRQTATITDDDDFDTHGDETDTAATCHDAHTFVHPEQFDNNSAGKLSYDGRPSSHFELDWTGFNGRCNKIADTCYAFWVGGALAVCSPSSFKTEVFCFVC